MPRVMVVALVTYHRTLTDLVAAAYRVSEMWSASRDYRDPPTRHGWSGGSLTRRRITEIKE